MDFFKQIVLPMIGIAILLIGSVIYIGRRSCYSQYNDYQPTWGFFSDCRIVYNGKLTPVNMIKNINLK